MSINEVYVDDHELKYEMLKDRIATDLRKERSAAPSAARSLLDKVYNSLWNRAVASLSVRTISLSRRDRGKPARLSATFCVYDFFMVSRPFLAAI